MSEPTSQPTTHFCFHCGHKVDPTRETCWYCGARLHRVIREPQKCPFCGSMIPSDAVKCRHCGEFVDGRAQAQSQAAPTPQQIVYVVDRALLGDSRGGACRLLPGQPVPVDVARQLSAGTVRAIETNQPRLLDDPRVRALPAPAPYGAGGVIDVDAEVASPASSGGADGPKLLPGATRDVALRGDGPGGSAMPARREDVGGSGRNGRGGLLAMFGNFLMRTAPGARQRPEASAVNDAIEVRPEERFRVCVKCGTEILAGDNFCFHCGAQYHQAEVDLGSPVDRRRGKGGNGFFFGLSATACLVLLLIAAGPLIAGALGLKPPQNAKLPEIGGPIVLGVAGVGLLSSVIAFFRRRTFFNQFVSIVLGLGALVLGLAALLFKP